MPEILPEKAQSNYERVLSAYVVRISFTAIDTSIIAMSKSVENKYTFNLTARTSDVWNIPFCNATSQIKGFIIEQVEQTKLLVGEVIIIISV